MFTATLPNPADIKTVGVSRFNAQTAFAFE
jgi:hypothetical protein